jgi:hypothetical protein
VRTTERDVRGTEIEFGEWIQIHKEVRLAFLQRGFESSVQNAAEETWDLAAAGAKDH